VKFWVLDAGVSGKLGESNPQLKQPPKL
jgi:hypothetical protein